MDTFEKIRALLAEQLDVDPAKITMDSDITVSYTHLDVYKRQVQRLLPATTWQSR